MKVYVYKTDKIALTRPGLLMRISDSVFDCPLGDQAHLSVFNFFQTYFTLHRGQYPTEMAKIRDRKLKRFKRDKNNFEDLIFYL